MLSDWRLVGPSQDVGLIFLSSMATSIAVICVDNGYEDHEALGTALLTLALSTLLVGVLIMLVGGFDSSTIFVTTIAFFSPPFCNKGEGEWGTDLTNHHESNMVNVSPMLATCYRHMHCV